MEKHFTTPVFPLKSTLFLLIAVWIELIIYAVMLAIPAIWVTIVLAGFYLSYLAIFRRNALPLIFALLFFTAHHSLLFYFKRDMAIAFLFLIIFLVNSGIMWFLLHYATHLKREYHIAYSFISGFMIAQIVTLFAATAHDWPFRFELAAYMATVFSYTFWRFACLSAEGMLGWKQFIRVAIVVFLLILAIIIGSPNVQV
jgi:hypothetical protein